MKMVIRTVTREELAAEESEFMRSLTPEERLSLLETLRQEGGKFAYEYPERLLRIINVTRRRPGE